MKRLLTTIAMLVALTGILSAGERDVVKPMIGDKLTPVRLTQQEMRGGEIDRRIMDLIYKNYMVLFGTAPRRPNRTVIRGISTD